MTRARTKTLATTIRLSPEIRGAWEAAAASERRSLASMFEIAMLDYVKRHGISLDLKDDFKPSSKRRRGGTPLSYFE
jgi:hypothetical protein